MNILDRRFKYVPAASTDLRKTFARIRREQREQQAREDAKPKATVAPIKKGAKA